VVGVFVGVLVFCWVVVFAFGVGGGGLLLSHEVIKAGFDFS